MKLCEITTTIEMGEGVFVGQIVVKRVARFKNRENLTKVTAIHPEYLLTTIDDGNYLASILDVCRGDIDEALGKPE